MSQPLFRGATRQQAIDDGRRRDATRIGNDCGNADPGIAQDFEQAIFSMARTAVIF